TSYFHFDISIFIAITFPIAFLTTTANLRRSRLAWTDVALAVISLAVALYYIVLNDRFLNWSRGFSQPTTGDVIVGFALVALVIELCRRSVGWGLTSLLIVLLIFTVFGHWMPGPLRHDERPLWLDLGQPDGRCRDHGAAHDPDHEEDGHPGGARRGDRGDRVERRRDAAAGDGRGGLHHVRPHQHPVREDRLGVVAAG